MSSGVSLLWGLQSLSVSEFMQKTSAWQWLNSTPLWTLPESLLQNVPGVVQMLLIHNELPWAPPPAADVGDVVLRLHFSDHWELFSQCFTKMAQFLLRT